MTDQVGLLVEREGPVLRLTLNRPERRNALSLDLLRRLGRALREAEREGSAAVVVLAARAAYVQVIGNAFFQRQGEVRYARNLELPANRGRILDRNGLLLASSVVAPSIWAIPEDVERDDPEVRAKLKQVAKLLDMPQKDFDKKLQDEDKTFVWIKRQVDLPIAQQIAALNIKGIYQRREYKREYPEGESAAHVVGFTNVEDNGQEGIELFFDKQLSGKAGTRRVIKDRLGRVVEGVGETVPPVDGKDIQLSIDSKVQFFAYQKLRDAVKPLIDKFSAEIGPDTVAALFKELQTVRGN